MPAGPFRRIPLFTLTAALLLAGLSLANCARSKQNAAPPPADGTTLQSPVRIALQSTDRLIVTDQGSDSVCTVDRATLAVLSCFPVDGRPLGLARSSSGTVFVGNETAQTVQLYSDSGTLLGSLPGTFASPASIAVDEASDRLFVLDAGSRTITLFTLAGAPTGSIITGDPSGNGKLVNPVALTVDPLRREVLVSDYGNVASSFPLHPSRVRIYDYAGVFVTAISAVTGKFARPQGLAVYGDRIFVTDGFQGQVLVFTRLSSTQTATAPPLGSFGDGPGQLMLPLDVTVAPASGDVFVTNNRSGRIEHFAGGGLLP